MKSRNQVVYLWAKWIGEFLWRTIILFFTVLICFKALNYFDFKVKGVLFGREHLLEHIIYPITFYAHIIFGAIALLIGPFQFMLFIRRKSLTIHRTIGKIYIVSSLASGVAAFYIGFFALGGWVAKIGFISGAMLWMFATANSYLTIRAGNIDLHKDWTHRSYAITFAAVTLRIGMGILVGGLGFTFEKAYPIIAWTSWVPNLIIMELFLKWMQNRDRQNFIPMKT